MSDKVTLQVLSEVFAKTNNLTKKNADAFIKTLFDTITEGLQSDGMVKVKGLGTFRCVDVDERESVSVSTGERVLIPGYKKVNFVPDDLFAALIDRIYSGGVGSNLQMDVVELPNVTNDLVGLIADNQCEGTLQKTEMHDLDTLLQEEVQSPENVEVKNDEFSGIDLLICTPESVEGVKEDLWKARNVAATMRSKAEQAISKAKDAEREVLRLEQLLVNLESKHPDIIVESPIHVSSVDEHVNGYDTRVTDAVMSQQDCGESVFALSNAVSEDCERNVSDKQSADSLNDRDCESVNQYVSFGGRSNVWKGWICAILILLLLGCFGHYWFYLRNDVAVENVPAEEHCMEGFVETIKPDENMSVVVVDSSNVSDAANVANDVDSITGDGGAVKKTNVRDSVILNEKPNVRFGGQKERPDKYVLKEGETLMMLARRYYGSPDSVTKIIEANEFANPNNVHVGMVVVLP